MLYRREIEIAPGAPPGSYWLELGVVSASLDARLPLLNQAGQMAGTAIRLGPFEVGPAQPSEIVDPGRVCRVGHQLARSQPNRA